MCYDEKSTSQNWPIKNHMSLYYKQNPSINKGHKYYCISKK